MDFGDLLGKMEDAAREAHEKHKASEIGGRSEMDALADLLTSNGYGVAGRQRKLLEAPLS